MKNSKGICNICRTTSFMVILADENTAESMTVDLLNSYVQIDKSLNKIYISGKEFYKAIEKLYNNKKIHLTRDEIMKL